MMLEGVIAAAAHPGAQGHADKVCAACHLRRAYAEARQEGYLWHEFGDSHLIIGARRRGKNLEVPTTLRRRRTDSGIAMSPRARAPRG
jgi:hypothetical protein